MAGNRSPTSCALEKAEQRWYYEIMSTEEIIAGALALPRCDQGYLAARLLEQLEIEEPLTEEQLVELRRRTDASRKDPSRLVSREKVWEGLNSRFGTDL